METKKNRHPETQTDRLGFCRPKNAERKETDREKKRKRKAVNNDLA